MIVQSKFAHIYDSRARIAAEIEFNQDRDGTMRARPGIVTGRDMSTGKVGPYLTEELVMTKETADQFKLPEREFDRDEN